MNKGSAVIFAANEVGIINSITTARTLGTVIHNCALTVRSDVRSRAKEVSRRIVETATLYGSLNKIGRLRYCGS